MLTFNIPKFPFMAQKKPGNPFQRSNAVPLDIGKIPPQAVELEEAVLGALLLEKDAAITVLDILKPESFYKDAHQKIYQSIIDLSMADKPIDLLTLADELKKKENPRRGGRVQLYCPSHFAGGLCGACGIPCQDHRTEVFATRAHQGYIRHSAPGIR